MANKNNPKVKIISECFIKPNCELEKSKNTYYLSASDLFQLSTNYSFRGLLYAKPASTSINSLVDQLKHSLSVALVDFYPLAGRLETIRYDEDHASWVYVDCNEGPGVIFIHATTMQESNDKLTVSDIVNQRMPLDLSAFFYGDDPCVVNYDVIDELSQPKPLPSNHFGNVALGVMATSKVKDLDSNGLGWAAMVIHKEIVGLDHKAISDFSRDLSEDPQVVQPAGFFGNSPPLIFTESMKFDAYGPQFGLGKAVALRAGHPAWTDGRIIMDPGREGGGSATLQIGLLSDVMTALEFDDEFKIYVS